MYATNFYLFKNLMWTKKNRPLCLYRSPLFISRLFFSADRSKTFQSNVAIIQVPQWSTKYTIVAKKSWTIVLNNFKL